MKIPEALAAIRSLDALPLPRRQHLCILATDARTDAERARIVLEARHEERRVRTNLDGDFRAELRARAEWAARNPSTQSEAAQRPSQRGTRIDRDDATTPVHRPVSVRYVQPSKTATAEQTRERRPLMGKNKVYPSERAPKTKQEPKPKTEPAHGTLARYQRPWQCRCPLCREVKRQSNARHNAKRAERSPKHGTTHMYNGSTNRAPCRCSECKAAKVVSNAKAREQMKLKKASEISPE